MAPFTGAVGHGADGGVGADLVGLVAFQGVEDVLDLGVVFFDEALVSAGNTSQGLDAVQAGGGYVLFARLGQGVGRRRRWLAAWSLWFVGVGIAIGRVQGRIVAALDGIEVLSSFSRRARFGATSMETLKAFRRVTGWR